MSIPVAVADLAAMLVEYPWGFLVTVGPDQRAHSLAVPTDFRDGALYADTGRSTRANGGERPGVSMVFPHPEPGRYSLIVDGELEVLDTQVRLRPESAVLHRPAID
ncbi:MAG: pyridoxamine 5'-phosphate oxidase family protein [Actinomycetota bacterium]